MLRALHTACATALLIHAYHALNAHSRLPATTALLPACQHCPLATTCAAHCTAALHTTYYTPDIIAQ